MSLKKIISQFLQSIRGFTVAVGFIHSNGLSKFYIFPVILALLLGAGGFALVSQAVDFISSNTLQYLELEANPTEDNFFSSFREGWETIKLWINGASTVVIAVILKVVFWVLLGILMKYVLLIFLAPVLAYVSEKTESIVTGNEYPFNAAQLTRDIWRGIVIALKNLGIEISILIFLSVITFFAPFLAPITALVGIVIGAYYYGYSMIDYISERRQLSIAESSRYVLDNAGMAIGLGLIITLMMKVPVLGFLTASFASIVTAVSAVLLVYGNSPDPSNSNSHQNEGVVELKKEI
ncbi:MAG: CysZ protein [Glaciecola sp.]|jgi:CysZ protein